MAEDIYFNKNRKKSEELQKNNVSFQDNRYTEKISLEKLNEKPGELSFSNIKTEKETISGTAPIKQKSPTKQNSKAKNKKQKKGRRIFLKLLCVVLAFIIIFSAAGTVGVGYILTEYESKELSENEFVEEKNLLHSSNVRNILLMGIDTLNTSSSSRSDAMILMSIDTKNHKIRLSSFLRDSYVNIPGHGNAKLNAACSWGGPQLVCDTIEANFGVRIDDYAKVGYDMFIKIIDAVGGITVGDIDKTEARALAAEGFVVEPGENIELNGKEALLYCRIRKGQSDFNRTARQREVISLVLKKIPMTNPVTLINTTKEIAGTIECSIDKSEFLVLGLQALSCLSGEIEQLTVPYEGTWYNATKNSQAVLVVDFQMNKEKINEFLYN